MCIAILTTAGASVDEAKLRQCFASNSHGSGLAYVDKDSKEVKIRKGFFTADAFLEAYKRVLDEGHGELNAMLLHFRIATMGGKTIDNCHPFKINNGAVIHNGSLFWGRDPTGKDRSDTRIWAEELLPDFTYERVVKQQAVLEQVIGYNKIAMLFNGGNYAILNESDGHWDEDVWYSNTSYQPRGSTFGYGRRTRWTEAGMSGDDGAALGAISDDWD